MPSPHSGSVPLLGAAEISSPRKPIIEAGSRAAPARDGDIAIQQEFEAAERRGTAAAFELFIARNPGHRLASRARERLEALRR